MLIRSNKISPILINEYGIVEIKQTLTLSKLSDRANRGYCNLMQSFIGTVIFGMLESSR